MVTPQFRRRPEVLTEVLKAEICDRIIECETISRIASDPHIPSAGTIYRALAQDEAFRQQYERAKVVQLYRLEEELLDMDGSRACDPQAVERLLMVTQRLIERRTDLPPIVWTPG